ncbi:hypothetical protein FSP39_018473 [Pinctada imbricata]|uniref:Cyclic nucleotide-binding domain-containing protein n=1 Tax=Pinctada imbricata TaxID=66713 RepID=A0AA88Y577_PINIB|nr:hypothetical protein FSP39_018473 [Pinctada imbricata]
METEETIGEIVSQLVIQEVGCGVDIILKGDSAKGVFLIMSGSVNVISTNGKDVLASLQEGDFFGEISVIFNTTCTATVQTATDCVLALLQLDDARRLLRKINTNVIEWFAVQRYFPTMEGIDVNRTNRRTAFKCLQNIPVFENWSEEALKSLIVQIEPALIILYPAKSPVMLENDPPNTLYIIIRGR